MSDEPKFCKDCKHYGEAGAVSFYGCGFAWPSMCHQPPERDLVTGLKTPGTPRTMRMEGRECGPEGLLWEEKPPAPPPALDDLELIGYEAARKPFKIVPITQPAAPRWWEFWK